MNLLVRINLALIVTFALTATAVGIGCFSLLQSQARQEAVREAALMMDSALAIRTYTSDEIRPLLEVQMANRFLPESVPSYSATQHFLRLRAAHPEYSYKEAALNPTDLRDRATDWETDLIQQFRNVASTHEIVGERDTPTGKSLFLARPISATQDCLTCHSSAAAAPAALVARYGANNGFGWLPHEIVGAQIVSVPLASTVAHANRVFKGVLLAVTAILLAALLLVNGFLYFLIVRPVRRIARIADEVSLGNMSAGEFPARGSPELIGLARSFNRMRTSLSKALKLLED